MYNNPAAEPPLSSLQQLCQYPSDCLTILLCCFEVSCTTFLLLFFPWRLLFCSETTTLKVLVKHFYWPVTQHLKYHSICIISVWELHFLRTPWLIHTEEDTPLKTPTLAAWALWSLIEWIGALWNMIHTIRIKERWCSGYTKHLINIPVT